MQKKLLGGALGTALSAWMLANMASAALPGAQLRQYVAGAQKDVIVVLRDQVESLPPLRRAMGARASVLAGAQSRVAATLPLLGGRRVTHFATINAFATSVTAEEAKTLAAHPDVQAIYNDTVIALPKKSEPAGVAAAAAPAATDNGLCNTLEPEALQLMNVASLDPKAPQAQSLRDGNGQPITGKGVKVAFLAEATDTNLPGFIHTDGSKVFVDYKDFSGEGTAAPGGGGESFIDSSAIAAQDTPNGKVLQYDISNYVSAAHALPKGCNIRVRGVAPGVSLVSLKIFTAAGGATTSGIVQAIEYAVTTDDVDVLNESFGGNAYPSIPDGPIDLANQAAVRAGVVVTTSTGDGGTQTLSEATERPAVIAVGASTSLRGYEQTGQGVAFLQKKPTWISNSISSFSSGGIAQGQPKVLDVVAPGDLGWALCSTNQALYADCAAYNAAAPTPIILAGGTSQSAPFTAGVAALIIQAYRSVHHGQDPTPALVKSLIMSTATDLGAAPADQGAGLVNAYAAVNAALSVEGAHANLRGSGLLVSPSAAGAEAEPEVAQARTFLVTNTGTTVRHLAPKLQALGTKVAGEDLTLALAPASNPCFPNVTGALRCYISRTFKVPANADHLDASIAFKSPRDLTQATSDYVYFGLIDPSGRQVAYSDPQGAGSGYGHVETEHPEAGTWTVAIWTRAVGIGGSYTGKVKYSWRAETFGKLGNVYPASVDLAPGASTYLRVQFSMPRAAGDVSAAVRFAADGVNDAFPAIPVTLRTLVPLNGSGGSFEGTVTGSNGRGASPFQSFAFDVPAGHSDMALTLNVSDPGWLLEGLLVDPNGMQLSLTPNLDPATGAGTGALSLQHYSPQPGRWHFVLAQDYFTSGNQTTLPFTAQIKFDAAKISAPGLPDNAATKLSASKTTSVEVQVSNNTPVRQYYFADARLPSSSLMQVPNQACSSATTIPNTCGLWQLPTQVTSAAFVAQSDLPLQMDAVNVAGYYRAEAGNPDVFAKPIAKDTVAAILLEPEVPYSYWEAIPALFGPYGAAGTATPAVTLGAFVVAKDFDPAVTADTGDLWADVVQNIPTFTPLVLEPGQSGTIKLSISPDATQVGGTVSGKLYIDTWNPYAAYGDEVVALPYRYTVEQ